MKYIFLIIALGFFLQYHNDSDSPRGEENIVSQQTLRDQSLARSSGEVPSNPAKAHKVVEYAKLFYGVPYRYGSSDPEAGFDCSGFITHVFTHFGIDLPRSSVDFTNIGTPVQVDEAAPGDLILFTGTDLESQTVGHIGIVVKNDQEGLEFIHSSSGKQYSVTTSPLEGYYEDRLVKVIRVI